MALKWVNIKHYIWMYESQMSSSLPWCSETCWCLCLLSPWRWGPCGRCLCYAGISVHERCPEPERAVRSKTSTHRCSAVAPSYHRWCTRSSGENKKNSISLGRQDICISFKYPLVSVPIWMLLPILCWDSGTQNWEIIIICSWLLPLKSSIMLIKSPYFIL